MSSPSLSPTAPLSASNRKSRSNAGLLLRAALPCAILVAGWWGFSLLSVEVEKKPAPATEKRTLRTKVEELEVIDYQVTIQTNAIVQAHNPVTLTAEVAGVVTTVNPAFEVGAYFKKGEVLVEIDDRNYKTALSIAKSRLLAAQSALKLATLNEERKLRLIESNAVSRAEVEVASATREQSEADLELAKAEVQQAQLNLERTKVQAPFDGRVRAKAIGLGQMAGQNSPLGEIFAIDFAEVRLPISGRQRRYLSLPEFSGDSPVNVELRDAINEASEEVWQAKIVRTEGVLDENSRDVFAIARIDDPFGRKSDKPPLRIGQPVTASIEGETLKDVVALPRNAVRQLDQIVLIDQQEQTILPATVEEVWSDANYVIVKKAAIPDQMWLATTPMVYTPEGAKVEIIPDADQTATVAETAPEETTESAAN